jgi:hypothetical protein
MVLKWHTIILNKQTVFAPYLKSNGCRVLLPLLYPKLSLTCQMTLVELVAVCYTKAGWVWRFAKGCI